MKRIHIFKLLISCIVLQCSITAFSKSNNTKRDYIDIEAKFYMGEYSDCSVVGDSIFYVENIYDAMILSYSAIANHKLAFAEIKKGHRASSISNFRSNFYRASLKAQDALDFIVSDLNANRAQINSEKSIKEKLQSYSLAVQCSRILQIPQYKQIVKYINEKIVPLKEQFSNELYVEKLQILYFEIIYALDHEQEEYVCKELLPSFEKEVLMLQSIEPIQKARIADIYVQLSEYLNYKMMETSDEFKSKLVKTEAKMNYLKDMAINTMIHSRDYSLYSKKPKGKSQFILSDWKQLKNELKTDEVAMLYFTYAKYEDSWNYILTISADSADPDLSYGGHSYMSESQALDYLKKLDQYKTIFVVGTNGMNFTNFSSDHRIVRLHTLSEIGERKTCYNNGNVNAIGNLKYSSTKDTETSTEKGVVRKIGEFASAEREMNSLKSIFGNRLKIYQGHTVTRSTFREFERNVSILHISTHGTFNLQLLNKYNHENADFGITGDNIFKSCGLMLSGYNDNKEKNFISAYDIKNLNLDNIDFVFISACESGAGQVLTIGDYSLAEAFYVAGVKNIIAVIDPIKEDVATNFAEALYKEISKGTSYHDSFYIAKNQVCPSERIILFE